MAHCAARRERTGRCGGDGVRRAGDTDRVYGGAVVYALRDMIRGEGYKNSAVLLFLVEGSVAAC